MTESNPNLRLEFFGDAVFAIALTLLIIDIKIPHTAEIHNTDDFWLALQHITPSIFAFVLSFIIILITWVNHHHCFKLLNKSSTAFMYANSLVLLAVVFTPFPTSLLGEYILTDHAAPAVVLYNSTLAIQALGWIVLCSVALRDNLCKNEKAAEEIRKNRNYGMLSIVVYSFFAIAANWFPLTVAIITILLWIVWLIVGIRMNHKE